MNAADASLFGQLAAIGLLVLTLVSCASTGQSDASIIDGMYSMPRGSVQPGDIHGLNGDISR